MFGGEFRQVGGAPALAALLLRRLPIRHS
jgi:hypothetical protein